MIPVDQSDRRRRLTGTERVGDRPNYLEVDFGLLADHGLDHVGRHQQIDRESVSNSLRVEPSDCAVGAAIRLAWKPLATVMYPMANLVSERKPLPAESGIAVVDRDNGAIAGTDDAGFASVERPIPDLRSQVPGYGVEVDIPRFCDSKLFENLIGVDHHLFGLPDDIIDINAEIDQILHHGDYVLVRPILAMSGGERKRARHIRMPF